MVVALEDITRVSGCCSASREKAIEEVSSRSSFKRSDVSSINLHLCLRAKPLINTTVVLESRLSKAALVT